jgi:hypothetical protein
MIREILEASKVNLDVSNLIDTYSDGDQADDDFSLFISNLKQFGMKDSEWEYTDSDETIISIPSKYEKHTKSWKVKRIK